MCPSTTARLASALATVAALIAAVVLLGDGAVVQALQKAAGYTVGRDNTFAGISNYLSNLRDGIMPLAVPAGAIGLAGAGFAYMAGNATASRMGMGVVSGVALVLLGPGIIQ